MRNLKIILILVILLFASVAQAVTTVTKVVDPDNGSGADYTSLSAWEAAQQGDLTGVRNEIAVAKCRSTGGTADTTALVVNGWTTSATQYIKIWTDPAETYRHNGTYQTGNKYRLIVSETKTIATYVNNLLIDGLQVVNTSAATTSVGIESTSLLTISNCIFKCSGNASFVNMGINSYNTSYIFNTIIYNCGTHAATMGIGVPDGVNTFIYNCTVVVTLAAATGYGIYNGTGTATIKNSYFAAGTSYVGATLTTSASSDASTGSVGLRSIAVNTTNFTNVTAGSEDFHLPVGSALINVGTDTHAEGAPLNFTTDIDGQTRTRTWDVGADEYYSPRVIRNRVIPNPGF